MEYYSIVVNFSDGAEFFGVAHSPVRTDLDSSPVRVKIPSQKAGSLFVELLNMDNSVESYILALSRFIGYSNASAYVDSDKGEVSLFLYGIEQIKKYINFHDANHLPYNLDFFYFLINGRYFEISDPALLSIENEVEENLYWDDRSGFLTDDISEIYHHFIKRHPGKSSTYHLYQDFFLNIALVSLQELIKSEKQIKPCKNCGKYFLPSSRSDEIYCDNSSPQDDALTCKQYGTRRLWYERQKNDELASLSKNIASAKAMLAKRNPDIPAYAISYEYFKKQRLIWQKAVKQNERSEDEYRNWLLQMREQKIIKEALTNGHD